MNNNAEIKCSKEFLNELISHQLIEPKGNGKFVINTKPNLRGEVLQIPVIYIDDHNELTNSDNDSTITVKENGMKNKSIKEIYLLYRACFPTNIEEAIGKEDDTGRSLRSGNKDRITERLKKRIDEGYDVENIINAIKYEVWWRVNESKKTNDNKLQYMRGMEAWINDTENLDSMIERSLKSTDFQNLINNRLPDESKRQVKIY
jgi:hypothetical protein